MFDEFEWYAFVTEKDLEKELEGFLTEINILMALAPKLNYSVQNKTQIGKCIKQIKELKQSINNIKLIAIDK